MSSYVRPDLQILDGFSFSGGQAATAFTGGNYFNSSFQGWLMQVGFVSSSFVPFIFLGYWIWGLISPDQAYAANGDPAFYMCYFMTYNFFGGYVFTLDQTYTYMRELLLVSMFSSWFAL